MRDLPILRSLSARHDPPHAGAVIFALGQQLATDLEAAHGARRPLRAR
jgi:hypothetical protein